MFASVAIDRKSSISLCKIYKNHNMQCVRAGDIIFRVSSDS